MIGQASSARRNIRVRAARRGRLLRVFSAFAKNYGWILQITGYIFAIFVQSGHDS